MDTLYQRIEDANEKTFSIIEDFFSSGFEKMLAEILAYLPKERQNSALKKLPPELQKAVGEIFAESGISGKKNDDADILSAAGYVLKKAGFYGKYAACQVVKEDEIPLPSSTDRISEEVYEKNPLLAMNLERYLVKMEIILSLCDRDVQKFLREIESQDLATALKGEKEHVQEKIFRNMSQRAAAMLREDMEYMGPVRKVDVLEAQKKCINIIKRLSENGEIVICEPGSEGDFIY